MSVIKFYQVEKEINGVKYKAQFNGLSSALKAVDDNYLPNSSNISTEGITEYILENVIVDPKVTVDDFDDMETLNKVVRFGRDVMQGKFRPSKNEGGDKAEGKK